MAFLWNVSWLEITVIFLALAVAWATQARETPCGGDGK